MPNPGKVLTKFQNDPIVVGDTAAASIASNPDESQTADDLPKYQRLYRSVAGGAWTLCDIPANNQETGIYANTGFNYVTVYQAGPSFQVYDNQYATFQTMDFGETWYPYNSNVESAGDNDDVDEEDS